MAEQQARILVVYTGGTIGMARDAEKGMVPLKFEALHRELPELGRFAYELEFVGLEPPLDSSNMKPEHWLKIAGIIQAQYAHFDGFVVLHGSDTMAYTASALSFLLQGLDKCVVLTGAQLPLGEIRTDARENFITSVEIAGARTPEGKSRVPEVCVYFDYQLLRGNRTRKYHAEAFDAFRSENYPALALAEVSLRFRDRYILPPGTGLQPVQQKIEDRVASLRVFPGLRIEYLQQILALPQLQALVLETYGIGNAPSSDQWVHTLSSAVERGLVVVNVSQCAGGHVNMARYSTGRQLQDCGVVPGKDMTFEAALTKLMILMGRSIHGPDLVRAIGQPLAGECEA